MLGVFLHHTNNFWEFLSVYRKLQVWSFSKFIISSFFLVNHNHSITFFKNHIRQIGI